MLDSELPRPHGGGVVPRRGLDAHHPIAAGRPRPRAVRRRARRAAAPPPIREAGRPRRRPRVGRGGAGTRRMERVGPAEGMRSWNLSSIWRLPLAGGRSRGSRSCRRSSATRADMLRPSCRATPFRGLLGHEGDRVLLDDVPGRRPVRRGRARGRVPRDGDDAWSTSRRPGSVASTTSCASGCPTGAGRGSRPASATIVQRRSPAGAPPMTQATLARPSCRRCPAPVRRGRRLRHAGHARSTATITRATFAASPATSTCSDWGDTGRRPSRCSTCPPSSRSHRRRALRGSASTGSLPGGPRSRVATPSAPLGSSPRSLPGRMALIYQTFVDTSRPGSSAATTTPMCLDWLSRTAGARDGR